MAVGDTYVYVDGLNTYYGALRSTTFRWLDYGQLVKTLLPHDTIGKIRYFTANVKPLYPGDEAHNRQNAYLRAVDANPLIDITRGHFRADVKWKVLAETHHPVDDLFRPILKPLVFVRYLLRAARSRGDGTGTRARVVVPEEKGSDVSLGAYLVFDALSGDCSKAVVLSNDSDLAVAIKLASSKIPVGIVNPHRTSPTNRKLREAATFEIRFRHNILARCQLPLVVQAKSGKQVHKPREW